MSARSGALVGQSIAENHRSEQGQSEHNDVVRDSAASIRSPKCSQERNGAHGSMADERTQIGREPQFGRDESS